MNTMEQAALPWAQGVGGDHSLSDILALNVSDIFVELFITSSVFRQSTLATRVVSRSAEAVRSRGLPRHSTLAVAVPSSVPAWIRPSLMFHDDAHSRENGLRWTSTVSLCKGD